MNGLIFNNKMDNREAQWWMAEEGGLGICTDEGGKSQHGYRER
jgi:hypothetical protein